MADLTVSLAPSAQLRITVDGHTILLPTTQDGMDALVRILQARARRPSAKVGTDASPTQAIVAAWLANEGNQGLMLAGKHKRRAEIKGATGVSVRDSGLVRTLDMEGIIL